MISRYTYNGLTWVDLESPTREEIIHISEEFVLPPLVGEEMFSSSMRSKVDLYDTFAYLIMHFPVMNRDESGAREQEVDFIIGKKFIITVRYESVEPLSSFAKTFETDSHMDRDKLTLHAGYIYAEMMKRFYHRSLKELEDVTRTIRDIENRIFSGQEESTVKRISYTSRKLLDFKQALRFHGDILESYETTSKRFFGEGYSYYASLVTSEFNKVNNVLEGHRDILSELQRTNDSLLSTKQNGVMKKFTIISFITFPLMLVTGIFGMNTTPDLIFIQSTADFMIIVGAIILALITMLIFFKTHKWL